MLFYDNIGFVTLIIGFLLNCTILMSEKLRSEKGYRNLLNYTIAATVRRAVPVLVLILPFRCLTNCIGQSLLTCKVFGFLDSLIAVYELESLTQVCIERLIYALYTYKGWHIPGWHNKLFISISLVLALLYSSLPVLLGYGSFGKDFDCVNCTFDILLPQDSACRLIIIVTFILKNLKPVVVMGFSLNFTRWMELYKIKKDNNSMVFTFSICVLVVVNITFWFPIFMVRSSVIMTQLLFMNSELLWSPCLVMWAISMHWIAPSFAMFGFIWYNRRVRAKMLNLISLRPIDSDEPTPPPAPDKASLSGTQPTQEDKTQEAKAQDTN